MSDSSPPKLFENSPNWELDLEGDWVCHINRDINPCIQIPGSGSMSDGYVANAIGSQRVSSLEEGVKFIREDLQRYVKDLLEVIPLDDSREVIKKLKEEVQNAIKDRDARALKALKDSDPS